MVEITSEVCYTTSIQKSLEEQAHGIAADGSGYTAAVR